MFGSHPESLWTLKLKMVLTPDDEVVGYVNYEPFGTAIAIAELGVRPGHSWRSVGRFLVRYLREEAAVLNATRAADKQLTNLSFNLGQAHTVYEALDPDLEKQTRPYAWSVSYTHLDVYKRQGIGGGGLINGKLLHGLVHPEFGHIAVPHDWAADPYKGRCPYHGDCLEGMAAGPAIGERWGRPAFELPADHPAWELEAHYLALALQTFICTLSPERIIMGGGVMEQPQLFPLLRRKVQAYLNGYVQSPSILDGIDNYIVPPGLGNRAGVLGAIAQAQMLLQP